MTNPALLPPVPVPDPDSAPFWTGLKNGQLMLCRCDDTGRWIHPPLERSRFTGGPVHFEEVSGKGSIFSYIVVRQPLVPGRMPPYVIALVELDEQPGLRINAVVSADPADIQIGRRVRMNIVELGDSGFRIPEFVLAAGGRGTREQSGRSRLCVTATPEDTDETVDLVENTDPGSGPTGRQPTMGNRRSAASLFNASCITDRT